MPPETAHRHIRAYLWLLAILIVIAGLLSYLQGYLRAPVTTAPASLPADAPRPTAADLVTAQTPFRYLISYTKNGFEPAVLNVRKGETVRFTNNGAAPLRISVAGTQSPTLSHGQYWQYSFEKSGTIAYKSGSGTSGTVVVQ